MALTVSEETVAEVCGGCRGSPVVLCWIDIGAVVARKDSDGSVAARNEGGGCAVADEDDEASGKYGWFRSSSSGSTGADAGMPC